MFKKLGLKTLFDLSPRLTPAELSEFIAEEDRKAAVRRAAMYKWSDEEVVQFIDAFKSERPDRYAEYIRQEIESGKISSEMGIDILQFSKSVFPHMNPDVNDRNELQLYFKVRLYVRHSLGLEW